MKRLLIVAVAVVGVVALAGEGIGQMRGPGGGWGGAGMMGPRATAGESSDWGCPMARSGAPVGGAAVTEEKARELAQQYADQYLQGFTVERVLPFTGMRGTMYSVELKGPEGQVRTFHINPWGYVMPFGGPGRRAG